MVKLSIICNKLKWLIFTRKLKYSGKNTYVGNKFKIINADYISIGNNFNAGTNLKLQTWPMYRNQKTKYTPHLVIKNNVSMMDNCLISCMDEVVINDGCLFGDNVFVTDNFHGNNTNDEINVEPIKRELSSRGKVEIGKNVWIGRNVCIMPGVTIGDGCIIGANAVVTKSFDKNCIVAGCPARKIKTIQ